MRKLVKQVVSSTAKNPLAWAVYRMCGELGGQLSHVHGHARLVRQNSERDETTARIAQELFPDPQVSSGPFKGLRYPALQSVGSMLLPKLLGSYESELHAPLEALLRKNYSAIVNIGCAEGYYAVGLALRCPDAIVHAFDTDDKARSLCGAMAQVNGVAGRVRIGSFCDPTLLCSISLGEKGLIICDCEGYEADLFNHQVVQHLSDHDVVVETHDFVNIDISVNLRDRFRRTHEIQSVKSTHDIEKAHTYRYPQLDRFNTNERFSILSERRPAIMEWLVMTPKAN
jgi:hypothetical protein